MTKTFVSFIVDSDGSLKDITFLTVNNIELNRAIAAALQLLTGWKPAMHNGKPVACRYTSRLFFISNKRRYKLHNDLFHLLSSVEITANKLLNGYSLGSKNVYSL